MTNGMLKMKTSLCDAINDWYNAQAESETDGYNDLDIPIGENCIELMADAAFNILLAQQDQNTYLHNNYTVK